MKYCILMGSPRKNGNTFKLIKPFIEELELNQIQYDLIWLYDKHIESCIACRKCQKDWSIFGCHYFGYTYLFIVLYTTYESTA